MQNRRRRTNAPATLALAAAVSALGCERGTTPAGGPEVRQDTLGDTIRVHTIAGSVWGAPRELVPELRMGAFDGPDEQVFGSVAGLAGAPDGGVYVYDRQVPALRRYGPDGAYVGTLGREGSGPGEYANSDGGLAVLPDGRVVLRDPANARFAVFGPDGERSGEWFGRGGHFTSQPLGVDTSGYVYSVVNRDLRPGETPWPGGMSVTRVVRIAPDGTPADTLDLPRYPFEPQELRAESERGSMATTVPFTGRYVWAVHPSGGLLAAVTDRYVVDLHRPDGRIVRMVRNPEPVPVGAEEKAALEERTTRGMREMAAEWRWNAAPIPDAKAPIIDINAGTNGWIWVRVATPSVRMPDPLPATSSNAEDDRLPVFREPPAWDVFEADGRYLGRVNGPLELSSTPHPVFAADHIWAVTRDSLDVTYITKYRMR